jgi:uncharacterized protein (DUF1697 family)
MLVAAMTVVISMLRGVNVGGHRKIKMDALRDLYVSLGLRNPQTYVQSGNVVFRTEAEGLVGLARRIEDAVEQRFGFRPGVILRTASDQRDAIARNPFARRHGVNPSKLLVIFLASPPSRETRNEILSIKVNQEEVRIDGRELYLYFPDGMGRSKVWPAIEKALKKSGTGRNWNTVNKLLEIAERLEISS